MFLLLAYRHLTEAPCLMDTRHEDEDVDVTEDTAVDAPSTGDDKLD